MIRIGMIEMAEGFWLGKAKRLKWPKDFHLPIGKGKERLAVELVGWGVEGVGSVGSPEFSHFEFLEGGLAGSCKNFSTFDPGSVRF